MSDSPVKPSVTAPAERSIGAATSGGPAPVTGARRATVPADGRLVRAMLGHGWAWLVLMVITRGLMLHHWAAETSYIANDPRYYFGQLSQGGGYRMILREYPLPVVWFLDLLRAPVAGNQELYVTVFAITMAVLDVGFAVWLWRGHSRVAAIYWAVFTYLLGPLVWFRYDVLPGVVIGMAVFLLASHPRASGALVALGAAIKLWPALLVTALFGRGRRAVARLGAFGVTGAALALLALVDAGWIRLVSPLTWQSDRGLQIESVWASMPMWHRAHGSTAWTVQMSPYNAYEIYGPGVEHWLTISSAVMLLGVLYALLVAVLCWRRGTVQPGLRALACLSIVLVMITGNKTLSPQYLAWLGAVSAAWFGLAPAGRQRRRAVVVGLCCLALARMTQYVYPDNYGPLLGAAPDSQAATTMLVARNLGILLLTVLTCAWTLAGLVRRPSGEQTTVDPGPVPRTGPVA